MVNATIHQQVTDSQALHKLWQFELSRYNNSNTVNGVVFHSDGTIDCPLCDYRHENSAVCQMDLGE